MPRSLDPWAEIRDRLLAGRMSGAEVAKALVETGDYAGAADAWTHEADHPDGAGIQPGDVAELSTPLGVLTGIVVDVFEDAGNISVRLLDEVTDPDGMTLQVGTERTFGFDTVIGWATPPAAEPSSQSGDLVRGALAPYLQPIGV
jgi:hypothetical protein